MDDIDNTSLKLEDAESESDAGAEGMLVSVDAPPNGNPVKDLLEGLETQGQPQEIQLPSKPETESEDVSMGTIDTDSVPLKPSNDMKIGVAFDYMRVKVKDIALLEKFTPAMRELYKEKEEEINTRPNSAASMYSKESHKKSAKITKPSQKSQEKPMKEGKISPGEHNRKGFEARQERRSKGKVSGENEEEGAQEDAPLDHEERETMVE